MEICTIPGAVLSEFLLGYGRLALRSMANLQSTMKHTDVAPTICSMIDLMCLHHTYELSKGEGLAPDRGRLLL